MPCSHENKFSHTHTPAENKFTRISGIFLQILEKKMVLIFWLLKIIIQFLSRYLTATFPAADGSQKHNSLLTRTIKQKHNLSASMSSFYAWFIFTLILTLLDIVTFILIPGVGNSAHLLCRVRLPKLHNS